MVIDILSANATTVNPITASQSSTELFLLLIVVFLSYRVYRGVTGARFSMRRVFTVPIIYAGLTILSFLGFPATLTDVAVTIIALVAGIFAGLRLGHNVKFYQQNNATYYKRSPFIMILWLVAYVLRFGAEFFIPLSATVNLLIEMLLGFSSGLLLGEAIHIYRKYGEHKAGLSKQAPPT
jgi:membrane protein CcdC involved in cytochrome C biogenesis